MLMLGNGDSVSSSSTGGSMIYDSNNDASGIIVDSSLDWKNKIKGIYLCDAYGNPISVDNSPVENPNVQLRIPIADNDVFQQNNASIGTRFHHGSSRHVTADNRVD